LVLWDFTTLQCHYDCGYLSVISCNINDCVNFIYFINYLFILVACVFGMKGEEQKKLDVLSNEVFIKALVSSGRTVSDCVIFLFSFYLFWGSEEGSALQHQGLGIFFFYDSICSQFYPAKTLTSIENFDLFWGFQNGSDYDLVVKGSGFCMNAFVNNFTQCRNYNETVTIFLNLRYFKV